MGILCSNGLAAFTLTRVNDIQRRPDDIQKDTQRRLDDIQRRLDDNQQDMKQMYLLLLGKGGKG